MFVDAGCQGRLSDPGVLVNITLHKKLDTKTLWLPQVAPFKREKKMLHFIGDEAFPFSEDLMKIFPG
jgi:hypothetical protein